MDIFGWLGSMFSPIEWLLMIIGGLSIPGAYYVITRRRRASGRKGRGKRFKIKDLGDYDLVVVGVDENSGDIKEYHMVRVAGNVYASIDSDYPAYYIRLGDDRIYTNENGEKVVVGRLFDEWIIPYKPDVEALSNLISHAEEKDLVSLTTRSVGEFIRDLLEKEETKTGSVVVPGIGKLVFSFKTRDFAKKLLESTLGQGILTVKYFMLVMEEMDKFIDYIRERRELEKVKQLKWYHIAGLIATIGIVAILFMVVYQGLFLHH